MKKIKEWFNSLDKQLLGGVLILMLIGLLAIWSIPMYLRIGFTENLFLNKALSIFPIAVLVLLATSTLPAKWIKRTCLILGGFALLLLGASIVNPHIISGTRKFVHFGPLCTYPALMLLPAFIVVLAKLLEKSATNPLKKGYGSYVGFLAVFFVVTLVILQHPDIGGFVLYNSLLLIALFIGGRHDKKAKALLWYIFGAFTCFSVLAFFMMPHVHNRFVAFVTGDVPYQIAMSRRALFNSSLFGGDVYKTMAIPDAHTDFVFAGLTGYFGYVFIALMLVVFWVVARNLFKHAQQTKDMFSKYFIQIVACLFVYQSVLHILANFGMIPLFGSVLPFVSYGSTPTLVYCLLFGAVLALTKQQAVEKSNVTEK